MIILFCGSHIDQVTDYLTAEDAQGTTKTRKKTQAAYVDCGVGSRHISSAELHRTGCSKGTKLGKAQNSSTTMCNCVFHNRS